MNVNNDTIPRMPNSRNTQEFRQWVRQVDEQRHRINVHPARRDDSYPEDFFVSGYREGDFD